MVQTKKEWDALSQDDKLYEIFMSFRSVSQLRDDITGQLGLLAIQLRFFTCETV
jgi:hypothetical protein